MRISLSFTTWFLPLTVFTVELGMIRIKDIQFDWISQPFFIFIFVACLFAEKIHISKYEFWIFLFLFIQGLLNLLLFNLPPLNFFSEFIPVFIIYYANKFILQKYDINLIFKKYVKFAYYAAIFGLIQFFLKLIWGFKLLTPFPALGIDSVALEPSHYVLIVLPAAVYLYEKKIFSRYFFLICLTLILTFKLTALASIALYLIFRNFQKIKNFVLVTPILFFLLYLVILQFPDFSDRFFSLLKYFQTRDLAEVDNLTSFSFTSNLQVALINFKKTFGFGIGLGGHETMYNNYFSQITSLLWEGGINAASAHSLAIRIISELGIIGISLFIILIIKVLKMPLSEYKIIALSSLSHFIVKSIKLGGYFDYGTLFFFTLIIVALQSNKILSKIHYYESSPNN